MRSGLPIERIREIRSPVGLDVRGRTPEEIAVSIMAEVLMFRLGGTGQPMKIEDWRIDRDPREGRGPAGKRPRSPIRARYKRSHSSKGIHPRRKRLCPTAARLELMALSRGCRFVHTGTATWAC